MYHLTHHTLMARVFSLLSLYMLVVVQVYSQYSTGKDSLARLEKMETILRIQDRRTIHDGVLINYLSDSDAAVRQRATLAYGSIQDTSVLSLLTRNLTDPDYNVQLAAAFAIGQTGTLLSPQGRERLEYDLIWKRLFQTGATERLIEEIGKFGTEQGLRDLMVKVGEVYPLTYTRGLTMSIARFATRGIVLDQAVRYVLRFIQPPHTAPWVAVYALQRIGDNPETRNEIEKVAMLYKHNNAEVRMLVATLLGKMKDPQTSLFPLERMSEFDGDWRVRVNALRALTNFDLRGKDYYVWTFKRAFYDANQYINITALNSVANINFSTDDTSAMVSETLYQLRYITENTSNNFPWQLQAEAAVSLATLQGKSALRSISLSSWPQPKLNARLLAAMAATGEISCKEILVNALESSDPILVTAALEGLRTLATRNTSDRRLADEVVTWCTHALQRNDIAIRSTAASILGDSLFARRESVTPLLQTLIRLRVPDDLEAMQDIIAALGKLKDDQAVSVLESQLDQPDRTVALAAANALHSITGREYRSRVPQSFEPLWTDFDFKYLRSLPDKVHAKIETSRGTIHVELFKDVAPFTVMSFLKLASQRGFYRGLTFHRVVPNFVVQGGDPRGDGWGGPGYSLRSEFSPLTFDTGMLGMASAGKDTEGSQFFITQSPQPHLDGRYTIFGRVVSGMEVVNRIMVDDRILNVDMVR